jgi:hypothetical protein
MAVKVGMATAVARSGAIDEHDRSEEGDERSHRYVSGRTPTKYDEDAEDDRRAHHLGETQRDEGTTPAEGRTQHRHQLDVATAHAAPAHDGNPEHDTAAHEGAERRLEEGWGPAGQRGQAQGVRQRGERDDVGYQADLHIKNDDQRQRGEQGQKLPPPRGDTESQEGQQGEAEGQPRTACERERADDRREPVPYPYLVDGGAVEPGSGRRRGAG